MNGLLLPSPAAAALYPNLLRPGVHTFRDSPENGPVAPELKPLERPPVKTRRATTSVVRLSGQRRSFVPSSQGTKYPIVLCHGLMGFDKLGVGKIQFNYWNGIVDDLRHSGHRVFVAAVSPCGDIRLRASQLREKIRRIPGKKVNVIAHSMGGLDARYLISRMDCAEKIASLTTIGTPHRGTVVADWGMHHIGDGLKVEAILRSIPYFPIGGFRNVTRRFLENEFNPATPNHPNVRYFSLAGVIAAAEHCPWFLVPYHYLQSQAGPNDGLVPEESAKWGDYLGSVGYDHLELVNWPSLRTMLNFAGMGFPQPVPDIRPMYQHLAHILAEEGL